MQKEEAKLLLVKAEEYLKANRYQESLDALDRIDAAFPNSRRVRQRKVQCYVGLGRYFEAEETCNSLEGSPGVDIQALRQLILDAQPKSPTVSLSATESLPAAETPLDSMAKPPVRRSSQQALKAENQFFVEMVTAVSSEETCVAGHVTSGAFHMGSMVSITTPEGLPLLAPILRIARKDTPLNVIRRGPLATMNLRIEARYLSAGATLTSDESDSSYAKTIIARREDISSRSKASEDSRLKEANSLLDARRYAEVQAILDDIIAFEESFEAYRLLARVRLENAASQEDRKAALEAIKIAYQLGGHDNPEVIKVLADAMAVNGEIEHGLRHLERLYDAAMPASRDTYAEWIAAFRKRHQLPDVWQFLDSFGHVILESSDIEKIRRAIETESVPSNALCRKNRIGEARPMQESIAVETPEIATLYSPPPRYVVRDTITGAVIGLVAGGVLSFVFPAVIPLGLGLLLLGVPGVAAGFFIGDARTRKAARKHKTR